MTMKRHIISFALLGALAAGVTGAAFAQGRDAAGLRASGAAGEQSDGFMGCVASCDAATQAAINEINAERRRLYAQTAEETRVSTAAAGAASFQNRLNCTNVPQRSCIASGNYIRMGGGAWTRK
jgi:uncharacterized protein YdbL (DUF1318 family)